MHPPRVPLDFDFRYQGNGKFHIASGDTGAFWFGALLGFGMAWNLWRGLRKDGNFGWGDWISPPADRDHPVTYWTAAAVNVVLMLAGFYMMLCGLIGLEPFAWL